VRLIAATNVNLEAAVAEGWFRQDLYYRLSVFTIHLPPLRSRGDDLVLLVQHYVRRFSRELGREVQSVSPEAMDALRRHSWPGNIRELQSVLKQALLPAAGPVLLPDFLPPLSAGDEKASEPPSPEATLEEFIEQQIKAGADNLHAECVRRLERLLLTRVLRHTNGNQVQAAKMLGITRGSLRTKIRDLGIRIDRNISSEE
jgi:two-component system nitrogen regulation response regulator GlnG